MTKGNSKKGVITISVIAACIFTAVILFLSISDFFVKDSKSAFSSKSAVNIKSDASLPENTKKEKSKISPEEVQGIYLEERDGRFYEFTYSPTGEFHGKYKFAYDHAHASVAHNPAKDYSEEGLWKSENGEIKLFIDNQYEKSLLLWGDYVIDSHNYFVGYVPKKGEDFQSSFVCRAVVNDDTQILNFYSDGKMIMETIHNYGKDDKTANPLQSYGDNYKAFVGNYVVENDRIRIKFTDESEKVFYILDDGIADSVYNKEQN